MYYDMIAKLEAKIKENRQVFQVSILHQLIWCVSVITKKARRYAPYVSAGFSVRVTVHEKYFSNISESVPVPVPAPYPFYITCKNCNIINIYHTITVYISAFSHPAA